MLEIDGTLEDAEEIEDSDCRDIDEERAENGEKMDGSDDLSSTAHSGSEDSMSGKDSESSNDSVNSDCHSDSSDEESEETIFQKVLYEGCNLSIGASCLLIIQFTRKYKLARKALNDLLTLIRLHFPGNTENKLPKTHRQLIKHVMPMLGKIKKVKVCSTCSQGVKEDDVNCTNGHQLTKGKPVQGDTFFLKIPLEPQLKLLVEGILCFI